MSRTTLQGGFAVPPRNRVSARQPLHGVAMASQSRKAAAVMSDGRNLFSCHYLKSTPVVAIDISAQKLFSYEQTLVLMSELYHLERQIHDAILTRLDVCEQDVHDLAREYNVTTAPTLSKLMLHLRGHQDLPA